MSKFPRWDRSHDERAYHRCFIVGLPLIALSVFLGWVAYRTIGTFPFTIGTTILLSVLCLLSGALGLSIFLGVIVLDGREGDMHNRW